MELIKQRGPYDCGVAALAMVLDCSYESAAIHIRRDVNSEVSEEDQETYGMTWGTAFGLMTQEMEYILFTLKRNTLVVHPVDTYVSQGHRWFGYPGLRLPDRSYVKTFLGMGGRAILSVPSLNNPGGFHWIAYDKWQVFDPSPNLTYEKDTDISDLWDIAVLIRTE